jgi:hypothetical protein
MLTINITQFEGYTTKDFLKYLQIQQPPILEVILPKESDSTDWDMIHIDYCKAAYSGQLLHDLSTDFFHNIPEPDTKSYFVFIVVTTEYEALAAHLYWLMASYTGMCEDDDYAKLDCDAADWISQLHGDEQLACPEFISIFYDYM